MPLSIADYQAFLNTLPTAALVVDGAGLIVLANPPAAALFGFPPAELAGRAFASLTAEPSRKPLAAWVAALTVELPVTHHTFDARRADRSAFFAELAVARLELAGAWFTLCQIRAVPPQTPVEAALRASEARYRLMADNAADVIWVLDVATQRFTYVSPSVERLRGYTPEEVIAQPVSAALTPESAALVQQLLADRIPAFLAGDQAPASLVTDVSQPCRDGSIVLTEVTTTLVQNERGQLEVVGVTRDVTARRRAEAALHESQATLNAVVDSTADLIWSVDPVNFGLLTFNRALVEHFLSERGLRIQVGMRIDEIFPTAEFVELWRGFYQRALAEGPFTVEYITFSGTRTLELAFNVLRRDGQVFALSVFAEDITARRSVEAVTKKYQLLAAHTSDIILIVRAADGRLLEVNEAAVRAYGYARAELLERSVYDLRPAAPHAAVSDQMRLAQADRLVFETLHSRRDGQVFPVEVSSQAAVLDGEPVLLSIVRDISERHEAHAALVQSEGRFARIFAESPIPSTLSRATDGLFLDANNAYLKFSGFSLSEIIGQTTRDQNVYADETERAALWETYSQQGRVQNHPLRYRTKSGVIADTLLWLDPIIIDGEPCILGVVLDVTEQQRAQAAVAQSEARFSRIFAASPMPITLSRLRDGVYLDANDAFLQFSGFSRAEVIGHTPLEQNVYPDPAERTVVLQKFREQGRLQGHPQRYRTKSGMVFDTLLWLDPITIDDEPCILALALDVTEQRRAQTALAQSEARFSSIFAASPIPVTLSRLADGVQLDANEAFIRKFGFSRDEIVGATTADLGLYPDPADRAVVRRLVHEQGRVQSRPQALRTKAGAVVECLLWLEPIIVDGEACLLALALDVTEQRQAEAQLRQLSRAVEQSPASIVITDTAGRIQYVNPKFTDVTGYTAAEALGENPRLLRSGETSPEAYRQLWATIAAGDEWRGEFHNRKKNGELYWESATISPIVDAAGRITHYLAVKEDITQRKASELALRLTEQRYRGLFEGAPIIMWEEDLSALKQRLAALRLSGVADLAGHLADHPELVSECAGLIKVIDANSAALRRYGAGSWQEMGQNAGRTFDTVASPIFLQALVAIEAGQTAFQWEGRHRTLSGEPFPVSLSWSALPGHEHDLSRVIVSVFDVTERVRAEAALKQRLSELEAVNRVSTTLRAAQQMDDMLPRLLAEAVAIVGGEAGGVWLYEAATDELWPAAQLGWRLAAPCFRRGEGVPGYVFASAQPYQSGDLRNDPRAHPAHRTRLAPGQSALCVPIRAADETSGALLVTAPASHAFSDGDARLLTTLAEIAGNAIHRMRLHEQTERRLSQLTALRAIDLTISANLDLPITLQILVDHVLAQLQVDAAAVLLIDGPAGGLHYAAERGFRLEATQRLAPPAVESYAGRIVEDWGLVALPDGADLPPHAARLPLGEDFRAYYGVPLLSGGHLAGVLEVYHRAALHPDSDWLEFLQSLAGQATIAIDNARLVTDLQRSNQDLSQAYEATIEGWSRALDLRDKETEGHSQRVTAQTLKLAAAMGMAAEQMVHVRRGALLHDIGKMGVPDRILLKPGSLTDDEWVIMRLHPQFAYDMLAPIEYLRPALDIPYCHHERWDGTGYPCGIQGEAIPLAARLFAVVDVWDALNSDRPYRPAWPRQRVLTHLQSLAGSQFDPAAVALFLQFAAEGRLDAL